MRQAICETLHPERCRTLYQTRPAVRGSPCPARRAMGYNPAHAASTAPRGRCMNRRAVALFFLSVAILYYSSLGTLPLLEPDEGRYAEIPREMLVRGDFVTPHLNGVVYLEKPPLFYWGNALSFALFGESESSARLFTATVSIAGVLLAYWMGAVLAGPRAGLFSAMVLSTSLYHYVIGRINTLDMTLAVAMIVAIFPAFLYLSGKRESRGYLLLSYAGAGLGFLAKGLIGIVFPGALCLRFTTKIHQHYEPFWFFLPIVIGGMFPWLAFARRAVRAAWDAREEYLPAEDRRFLFCWVLFVLLFFSFSRSKLVTYAAPIFPPLAVLFGCALESWVDREDGPVRCRFPLGIAAILAAGILVFPTFTRYAIEPARWIPLTALPAVLILLWGGVPLFVRRLWGEG